MIDENGRNTKSWRSLETFDASLITTIYDAAQRMSYDVEWDDDPMLWCLQVFCSEPQWQALTTDTYSHTAHIGGTQL